MNYIYDIFGNFFENYYDFYEWNKSDKIIHIKKIPIIKVNKLDYKILLNNKFKINKELLNNIKNKTLLWNNKKDNYLLITNGSDLFNIKFNNQGISTLISSLQIEEELDILSIIKKIKTKKINYKLLKKNKTIFKTRKSIIIENNIITNIKKLSPTKDINKINYIYYECFNKLEKNTKKALIKIIKNINNYQIINKLNNFFELNKTK